MSISEEIERLNRLRLQGVLSDDEFASAKRRLIGGEESRRDDDSVGRAANRYVTWQMVMGVIGLILFLIVFLTVFLPGFNQTRDRMDQMNGPAGLPEDIRRQIETKR